MKFKAGKMLFGAALSAYLPAPASAYEVDCAILLCLSAGWPASVECNHARNVFIQRITPWTLDEPQRAAFEAACARRGDRCAAVTKLSARSACQLGGI